MRPPRAGRLALLAAGLAALLAPAAALAHPLGNFTVNHYSRLEPAGDGVRLVYVLDMAEIPTFQEQPKVDAGPDRYADERAEEIRRNVRLTLDGAPATLRPEHRALSQPPGQGGLPTLRLEATYLADLPAGARGPIELAYRDDNDPSRIGWREIVARPGAAGTVIHHASVPAEDRTDELRAYPEDLLNSPLDVRAAQLTFSPGGAAARPAPSRTGLAALDRTRGAFADLARGGSELSPAFVLFALAVALVLGAGHALQPGHGKTVVAAYLVGSRGTPSHAVFLGATVTATHTAGVYALGLVTLFLSRFVLPERLYPVLEVASGLLVVGIGAWLFGSRLLAALRARRHHHDHDHAAAGAGLTHTHGGRTHTHRPPGADGRGVSWRSLLALGVSGGLLPCPEALMVLLITIAAHRLLFGLLLVVAFSLGLAGVLVGFGLLLVYARALFQRLNLTSGPVPRLLPVASALVIVAAGAVITAQALPRVV